MDDARSLQIETWRYNIRKPSLVMKKSYRRKVEFLSYACRSAKVLILRVYKMNDFALICNDVVIHV